LGNLLQTSTILERRRLNKVFRYISKVIKRLEVLGENKMRP